MWESQLKIIKKKGDSYVSGENQTSPATNQNFSLSTAVSVPKTPCLVLFYFFTNTHF